MPRLTRKISIFVIIIMVLCCATACKKPTNTFLDSLANNNYTATVITYINGQPGYLRIDMMFDGDKYFENSFGVKKYSEFVRTGVWQYTYDTDGLLRKEFYETTQDNYVYRDSTLSVFLNLENYSYDRINKVYMMNTTMYEAAGIQNALYSKLTFLEESDTAVIEYEIRDGEDLVLIMIRIGFVNKTRVEIPIVQ